MHGGRKDIGRMFSVNESTNTANTRTIAGEKKEIKFSDEFLQFLSFCSALLAVGSVAQLMRFHARKSNLIITGTLKTT